LPRVVRRTSDRRRAEEWSFVLRALAVIHEIREEESGYGIAVLPEDEAHAAAALDAHEAERAEVRAPLPEYGPSGAGWVFAVFLLAVHLATGARDEQVVWFAKGSADTARILHGEWFRVVTALSLHADVSHVLGNAIVGGLLLSQVLTLYTTPVIYLYMERVQRYFSKKKDDEVIVEAEPTTSPGH